MSKLRPEANDSTSTIPSPKGGTAYLLIYTAVRHQAGLIHGRLHDRGRHCAIGSFWTDNPKLPLESSLIDEVAMVNDSVPHYSPARRREHVLRWLKWRLQQHGFKFPGRTEGRGTGVMVMMGVMMMTPIDDSAAGRAGRIGAPVRLTRADRQLYTTCVVACLCAGLALWSQVQQADLQREERLAAADGRYYAARRGVAATTTIPFTPGGVLWSADAQPPVIPYPGSPVFRVDLPRAANGWKCLANGQRFVTSDGVEVYCVAY